MQHKEVLIPFFIYDKNQNEAFFIVLESKQYIKGVNEYGERSTVQESAVRWSSRPSLGT